MGTTWKGCMFLSSCRYAPLWQGGKLPTAPVYHIPSEGELAGQPWRPVVLLITVCGGCQILKLKRWRRSLHTAYNIHGLYAYSHLTISQSGFTATCNMQLFNFCNFEISDFSILCLLNKSPGEKKVLDQHDFRVHPHYTPYCLSQEDQRFLLSYKPLCSFYPETLKPVFVKEPFLFQGKAAWEGTDCLLIQLLDLLCLLCLSSHTAANQNPRRWVNKASQTHPNGLCILLLKVIGAMDAEVD